MDEKLTNEVANRLQTYDEFQREKESLQKDLSKIHTSVIER